MEQRLEIRTEEKKTILKNANKLQHRQDKSKRQLIKAQKNFFSTLNQVVNKTGSSLAPNRLPLSRHWLLNISRNTDSASSNKLSVNPETTRARLFRFKKKNWYPYIRLASHTSISRHTFEEEEKIQNQKSLFDQNTKTISDQHRLEKTSIEIQKTLPVRTHTIAQKQ